MSNARSTYPSLHTAIVAGSSLTANVDVPQISAGDIVAASQPSIMRHFADGNVEVLPGLDELEARFDRIVADHYRRIQTELPAYAEIPSDHLVSEILPSAKVVYALMVNQMFTDDPPSEVMLQTLRNLGAGRAEDGFEFSSLISAYSIGLEVLILHYFEIAPPEYHAPFLVRTQRLFREIQRSVAEGFLEAMRYNVRSSEAEAQRLLDRILVPDMSMGTRDHLAERFSETVDVVLIRVGRVLEEDNLGNYGVIASNRKVRRIRAAAARLRPGKLSDLRPEGGTIIFPVTDPADRDESWIAGVVEEMSEAARARVVAAHERCTIDAAYAACDRLRDVLALGSELRPSATLHRMQDVAMEYQLTRPGLALDVLESAVAPIAHDEDLLNTVLRYLVNGRNRRRTALDLTVHPNTVDYRVAKASRLTGLDPVIPADANLLYAALTAVRFGDMRRGRANAAGIQSAGDYRPSGFDGIPTEVLRREPPIVDLSDLGDLTDA